MSALYDQTILLGVVVSILFSELTGLSPAGLVVPGYIAVNLHNPLRVVYTLLISLLAMALVKLLGRVTILYGRRRFAVLVLLAFALSALIRMSGLMPFHVDVIGCVIPGIVAREFDRQGVVKTLLSLAVVTGVLVVILLLCGWPVLSL